MDAKDSMKLNANLFGSVKDLMLSLGVSEEASWQSERAKNFLFEKEIESNKLTSLSLDVVRAAAVAWGKAFELKLWSTGIREFEAVGSLPVDEKVFHQFKTDLQGGASTQLVNIRVYFDKAGLAKTIFQEFADVHFAIFIFASAFMRTYSGTFREIDQIFFPEPKESCVCLVLEKDVSLFGPNMAIIGPTSFEQFQLKSHHRTVAARQDRARETRSDNVSWIDFDTRLTPYHLLLTSSGQSPEELGALAARKLFDLTLIYIADSVRHEKDGYEATFSGVPLARVFAPLTSSIAPNNSPLFFKLFQWAYLPGGTDKLAVLRSVIPSFLTGDRNTNHQALDQSARRISETTRASYASLVRGVVTRHFDKLKEVDKYVQETGFQLGGQISGLAANLTTNMLGTVAVIVGAFISFIIDKKATPRLLAVGTLLYGGYVLFFPLFYSLLLQNLVQYVITVREFRKRIREFAAALNLPGLSSQYEPMIRSRRWHFWAIFGISCLIYVLLILASYILYGHFKSMPTSP
jgi:hypothetical protein